MVLRLLMRDVFSAKVAASCVVLAMVALASTAQARPDTPGFGELWHYAPGDKVESLASLGGNFRIHFTRNGVNAVPPDDADADGVPDHVQSLAEVYEQVLSHYVGLGFLKPKDDGAIAGNNGGDARFDVYLVDFALKADGNFVHDKCSGGVCNGYMVQENDFEGYGYPSVSYANRVLASHEFFHAVQAAYDAEQGSIFSEGTAVWATENFDPTLSDFENLVPGYLEHPDRPLDKAMLGPVASFSYGAALFFQFLAEHISPNVMLELWTDCVNGAHGVADPQWFPALDALLVREHDTTFASQFVTFATWNLFTNVRADPMRSYAHGKGYPLVAMTSGDAPYFDEELRLYYASTQYVGVAPDGRKQMTATVMSKFDLKTMRLALVVRHGKVLSDPVTMPLPPVGPPPVLDTTDADEVIAMVINTATSGESLRGTLCIGAPDEVAECLPAVPVTPTVAEAQPDAGVAVGAEVSTSDAGSSQSDAGAAHVAPVVSGCAASAGRPMTPGAGIAVLLLSVLAGVRAARRRSAEEVQS